MKWKRIDGVERKEDKEERLPGERRLEWRSEKEGVMICVVDQLERRRNREEKNGRYTRSGRREKG